MPFGFHPLDLIVILVIALLIALLIWTLIRWLSSRSRHVFSYNPGMPPAQPSALEILRQRYARGEIDTATFEHMRERLENPGGPGSQ